MEPKRRIDLLKMLCSFIFAYCMGCGGGGGRGLTVEEGLSYPWALALDGPDLYFTEGRADSIGGVPDQSTNVKTLKKVPAAGGRIVTIDDSFRGIPGSILLHDSMIYLAELGGCIKRIFASGNGAVVDIWCDDALGGNLITDNLYLYASTIDTMTPGQVWRIDSYNGMMTTVASGLGAIGKMAISDGYIYFTEMDPGIGKGSVKKVSVDGGTPSIIASGFERPFAIAVENGYVYFTDAPEIPVEAGNSQPLPPSALYKIPLQGGIPVLLSDDFTQAENFLLDGNNIYVAENYSLLHSAGTVKKISIHGGEAPVVVGEWHGALGLAVDDQYIYWTEPLTGKIQRALK